MKVKTSDRIVIALTIIVAIIVFHFPAINQPSAFHQFADGRKLLGINNCLNVISNLPFLAISICGFVLLNKGKTSLSFYLIYSTLFLGVALTAFGSAFYHSDPNNQTLVWDRLPMTMIFMSFTCATVASFVNERLGLFLLLPLLFIGTGSVLWWSLTQAYGRGDLRLYFLVQYYPMVLIPLILLLYYRPHHKQLIAPFVWVVVWYGIAKLLERWDVPINHLLGISGHTLKHLAAAVSTWYFVEIYKEATLSKEKKAIKPSAQAIA